MQPQLLEPVDDSKSLALLPRADSTSIFQAFLDKAKAAAESAAKIKVTDITDTTGPKMARAARLSLREIRTTTENRRKEMVEGMTQETRRINGLAKQVKDFCEECESALLEAEQFVERETLRIEDERRQARTAELNPYLTGAVGVDLGKIDEKAYQELLANATELHTLRMERERKAEADRLAAIEAERVEQERIRAENARLKQEAEEREVAAKAEREEAAAKQRELEAAARAEREAAVKKQREIEAAARAEREEAARREAAATEERRRAEAKAKAEQDAAEAKVREAERKERQARAEAEAAEQRRKDEARKAQEEAERKERQAKAEAERAEAARQAAEAEAARRAAAAPDKEKLLAFAAALKALPVPMLSAGSSHIQQDLARRLAGAVSWITTQANEI